MRNLYVVASSEYGRLRFFKGLDKIFIRTIGQNGRSENRSLTLWAIFVFHKEYGKE